MNPIIPPSSDLWLSLERYVAGTATTAERDAIEHQMAADAEYHTLVTSLQAAWDARLDVSQRWDARAAYERMVRRQGIQTERRASRGGFRGFPRFFPRQTWQSGRLWGLSTLVAVLLVLAGVGIPAWMSSRHQTTRYTTYATANGQRATITLTDGTVVTLNVASRIDLPQNFGGRHRTVRLRGEAFFQVVHIAGAPFTVNAQGTRTTVLGTAFGVRAYQPGEVQVAVQSGRVSVDDAILGANDIASAEGERQVSVARHQDLDAALGFVTGRLVLPATPLRDAVASLDRWYDVDIQLGSSALDTLPVQGVLVGGSMGTLMELLQGSLHVRVVRDGRRLTLYER